MIDLRAHRLRSVTLSVAVMVGGCATVVETVPPTATPGPHEPSGTPWVPAAPSGLTCPSPYGAPPYAELAPVAGLSVRVIDRGHFEIFNATGATYYFAVYHWEVQDNLVCGRGVTFYDSTGGPAAPGSTEVGSGSTRDIPATVSIWAEPCGEGCARPPIGGYVVPISDVPAPPFVEFRT
jgi:hypothetical protein